MGKTTLICLLMSSLYSISSAQAYGFSDAELTIRIANPVKLVAVGDLDPAKAQYAHEYKILSALMSPLIDQGKDGQFIPAVAESISWHGDELWFSIKKNIKTISGRQITAEDASFSLKRMMVLARDSHARILINMLCPTAKMKHIDDACQGITVKGSTLILKPVIGKTSLVQILPSVDFGVLSKESIDPKTLEIRQWRDTSGPYYLDRINADGSFELKANYNHWRYSKSMPQTAVYVPRGAGTSDTPPPFDQFLNGQVDFIPSATSSHKTYAFEFAEHHPEAKITFTSSYDSRTLLIFTAKGMAKLSLKERFAIGKTIRTAYWERAVSTRFHKNKATQWLTEQGEGNLMPAQLAKIQELFDQVTPAKNGHGLKLSTWNLADVQAALQDSLSDLAIKNDLGDYQHRYSDSDEGIHKNDPDMYILNTSGMWEENLPFLDYAISQHYVSLNTRSGQEWLRRFMSMDLRQDRLEAIRKLHFDTLISAKIVPLVCSPHYDVLRATWSKDENQIGSTGMLWEIHRN